MKDLKFKGWDKKNESRVEVYSVHPPKKTVETNRGMMRYPEECSLFLFTGYFNKYGDMIWEEVL